MDEQNEVYPYNGILFSHERGKVLIPKVDTLKNMMLSERSQTQMITYCMFPFNMKYP